MEPRRYYPYHCYLVTTSYVHSVNCQKANKRICMTAQQSVRDFPCTPDYGKKFETFALKLNIFRDHRETKVNN